MDGVKDRVTSPTKRAGVGSNPTGPKKDPSVSTRERRGLRMTSVLACRRRASSSVAERLMFPGRLFPSRSLERRSWMETWSAVGSEVITRRPARSRLPKTEAHSDCIGSLRKEEAVGSNLEKFFFQMGARVKHVEVAQQPTGWRRVNSRDEDLRVVLDIKRDKQGSFFEIRTLIGARQELLVLNAEPRKKHLLLLSRQFDATGRILAKQKFLCGQDERHWFFAPVPEDDPLTTLTGTQTPPMQPELPPLKN